MDRGVETQAGEKQSVGQEIMKVDEVIFPALSKITVSGGDHIRRRSGKLCELCVHSLFTRNSDSRDTRGEKLIQPFFPGSPST